MFASSFEVISKAYNYIIHDSDLTKDPGGMLGEKRGSGLVNRSVESRRSYQQRMRHR